MEEEIFKINEMLPLLKTGIPFFGISNNSKKQFYYSKKCIIVIDTFSRYKLSEKDFIKLFSDMNFYILDLSKEVEIDVEKDKEYYSWRQ